MKRIVALAVLGISILAFNSCILDPKEAPPDDKGPGTSPYKPLDEERDNVLFNLQKAYNERNIDRYDELLDTDFNFYFSTDEAGQGLVPVQWGRAAEIGATTNMFNPNYTAPGTDPVSRISLSLTYPEGDHNWTQVTPDDQQKYPGETWYQKTVEYFLTVEAGQNTYIGRDYKASYVVRFVPVETDTLWRIITWRDNI